MSSAAFQRVLRCGLFEFDLATGDVRKQGRAIKLQDQPRAVLRLLLAHVGEIVTREELRSALWPDGTVVDFENGLNVAIKKIRWALGDSASSPHFIETIPRRGYRFIGPPSIDVLESSAAGSAQSTIDAHAPPVADRPE